MITIDKPYLIGYHINEVKKVTREFIELPPFRKAWQALCLDDKDLERLEEMLLKDPEVGAMMQGTGGVRKMRFPFENRGKSGSVRVIYVDLEMRERLYLLTAYAKSDRENLTQEEKNNMKKVVEMLKNEAR